jgi:hypothetical protein
VAEIIASCAIERQRSFDSLEIVASHSIEQKKSLDSLEIIVGCAIERQMSLDFLEIAVSYSGSECHFDKETRASSVCDRYPIPAIYLRL